MSTAAMMHRAAPRKPSSSDANLALTPPPPPRARAPYPVCRFCLCRGQAAAAGPVCLRRSRALRQHEQLYISSPCQQQAAAARRSSAAAVPALCEPLPDAAAQHWRAAGGLSSSCRQAIPGLCSRCQQAMVRCLPVVDPAAGASKIWSVAYQCLNLELAPAGCACFAYQR